MLWWDPAATFGRQFEPCDEGYLFYPRSKSGGKLITPAEYEHLLSQYRRWMGGRFKPGYLFWAILGGVIVLSLVVTALNIDESISKPGVVLLALGLGAMSLWLQYAPYRLVRDRPDVTPPRSKQERHRAARSVLPWFMLIWLAIIMLLLTIAGTATLLTEGWSLLRLLWTLFWAAALIGISRMGWQKFRDSRR